MLDLKNNSSPLYMQITQYFINKIHSGVFKPGDKLPSEELLAEQLGVSRMTVNKAIRDLTIKGLVTRIPGAGTFVNSIRYEGNASHFFGFMDYMTDKGFTCTSQVIKQSVCIPPKHIAEILELDATDEVYEISRLRQVNNLPMVLQTAYINAHKVHNLLEADFTTDSLYHKIYEITGHRVASAVDRIEAIPCPSHLAKKLHVKSNFPLLYITRIGSLDTGEKIELTYSWYRSDQYILEVKYQ
ncbi:GntR family transcriptional regulator [Treponema sp. OMZ 840]|uniref:GntR family transcriptional regulator n=1 Tax=Treponema sp. OMZ 840 TaxID=244313 RepID=UPI003D940023